MKNVLAMAGNYASHAIWSVSDGETLIPIVGYLKADGSSIMERLMMGSVDAISAGHKKINEPMENHIGATLITDAHVTLETGRTDCLIVDVAFYGDTSKK